MPLNNTTPVTNPTWYADIRNMFTTTDIEHMRSQGLDLSLYEVVSGNASIIYGQVASKSMPPNNPWSDAWIATFLTWMSTGCPKGTNPQPAINLQAASLKTKATGRIRKEITALSADELTALKKAFQGMLDADPDDVNSYFYQAGTHWLPGRNGRFFCQHHAPGYNPWHRAYLFSFENALRSVPGCENVTLPYWDITKPIPDVLKQAPFDKYVLPKDIGLGYNKGYTTTRYSDQQTHDLMLQYGVVDDLNNAMVQTDWEDFHGYFTPGSGNNAIIAAHDGGHVSIGDTMAVQNVASFDPIFWFFHANWDRLFWKWQKSMQATTLNGLLSTINQTTDLYSYQIFTNPILGKLDPFTDAPPNLTTVAIIDSVTTLDVDYAEPASAKPMNFQVKTQLASSAAASTTVHTDTVNVRVGNLNRLKIPGSFSVHLMQDGKRLASKAFFQPNEADKCEKCVGNAIVNFDFKLPLEVVSKGKLSVWVEPVDKSVVGERFPNKLMGNPTLEAQFLLSTE